jgi:hypothetical protein
MAATASPFGLRPINLIGGQSNNGGVIREYLLPSNVAFAYFTGQIMTLAANGVITPAAASPTTSTVGLVGVCVGVRYTDPTLKYTVFGQYLPPGAYNSGYRDIYVRVTDDPDQLFSIQAETVVGSRVNGARGSIGQNAATTGLSNSSLATGANWGSTATTSTFALRIVDIITPDDLYPEVLVKFNHGVHSYYSATGVV